MLRRLSDLQEEKRRLAWDKANLTEGLRRAQQELELERQANRYQRPGVPLLARPAVVVGPALAAPCSSAVIKHQDWGVFDVFVSCCSTLPLLPETPGRSEDCQTFFPQLV